MQNETESVLNLVLLAALLLLQLKGPLGHSLLDPRMCHHGHQSDSVLMTQQL